MKIDINKNLDKINLADPVVNFIHYPENVIHVNKQVYEAVEGLWNKPFNPHIGFFYIIDDHHILCGVISSHKLLHGKKEDKITDLMETHLVKLKERYSMAEALLTLAEEKLIAVPVVNEHGVLLGVIELVTEIDSPKFDQLTHGRMRRKAAKELYHILGLSVEQHHRNILSEYCSRMPWLLGNIAAGLICAAIMLFYHEVISGTFILALFIPLVLTLCESIAMQATVNTSHYLRQSKIPWKILFKRGYKELNLAIAIAFTAAVITGGISSLFDSHLLPIAVISFSIFFSMIVASGLGMGITILVHKLGLDSKFASGPTVLMFTDIAATTAYFTLAYFMLQ